MQVPAEAPGGSQVEAGRPSPCIPLVIPFSGISPVVSLLPCLPAQQQQTPRLLRAYQLAKGHSGRGGSCPSGSNSQGGLLPMGGRSGSGGGDVFSTMKSLWKWNVSDVTD